jgi:hypothetical protein
VAVEELHWKCVHYVEAEGLQEMLKGCCDLLPTFAWLPLLLPLLLVTQGALLQLHGLHDAIHGSYCVQGFARWGLLV